MLNYHSARKVNIIDSLKFTFYSTLSKLSSSSRVTPHSYLIPLAYRLLYREQTPYTAHLIVIAMVGRGRGRGSTLPSWMTHGDDRPDIAGHNNDRDHRRPAPPDDRGHRYDGEPPNITGRGRGLGYRTHAPPNRDYWERDRPREDVNFVRGETIRRDDGDNRMDVPSAGRGRGRGRGVDNRPAWMDGDGPIGAADADAVKEEKKDETLELLLAQARQVQQEQLSKKTRTVIKEEVNHKKKEIAEKEKAKDTVRRLETEKRRQLEEEKKAQEEERNRLELEREAEEQRQLLALVGDDMEEDDTIKKRRHDSEEDIFEFDEEGKEERLARQRREERRKKLKVVESHDSDKVDMPRNPAGVIASEVESMAEVTLVKKPISDQNYEVVAPKQSDSDDSFDIFAADNPTPIPTQSKNGNTRNATTISKSNIAQECDDVEGYYKASIGEIITVPKYRGSNAAGDEEDENRIARFRVLGIIGKGVFSTVIKVIEETNDSNLVAGREMAMKVIRNNEVMAKAAAKEMRILRMLCRPRDKKKKGDDDDKDNNEEDPEEKERRERENHNIVRLLEVDPTFMAKDSSSYAIPPLEFRSHCIFLFEFLPYNLREVLSKFGKNVGITLSAVRSYARQLLCALGHLERHRIVHGKSLCI